MPRPAKTAYLRLKQRKSGAAYWIIRDGAIDVGTGCSAQERGAAEKALAEYLAKKHTPDYGSGDPYKAKIADVLTANDGNTTDLHAISALPMLQEFWKDQTLAAITPKSCDAYVKWRCSQYNRNAKNKATARKVQPSTARRDLEVLRAAIFHAAEEKLIRHSVPVSLPGKPPARTRWLSREEADRLLAAAWARPWSHHVARFIVLGLLTGSRHRALLELQWMPNLEGGWVDLEQRLIYRRAEAQTETAKRRPPVKISERLLGYLREWERTKGRYVIEFQGQPVRTNIRNAFRRVVREAGLGADVTPHTLRHTFASWGIQAGISPAKIAAAIGTTEAIVVSVYGHLAPDYTLDAVEAVAGTERVSGTVSGTAKMGHVVK